MNATIHCAQQTVRGGTSTARARPDSCSPSWKRLRYCFDAPLQCEIDSIAVPDRKIDLSQLLQRLRQRSTELKVVARMRTASSSIPPCPGSMERACTRSIHPPTLLATTCYGSHTRHQAMLARVALQYAEVTDQARLLLGDKGNLMTDTGATATEPIQNGAFSAFIFSVLGWALFLAWSINAKAGYGVQVLPALIGIILATVAIRRCLRHWPGSVVEASTPGQQRSFLPISFANALSLVLMVLIGYAIARLVFLGSAFLMVVFAFGASLVPWSRIPLCRNRFFSAGSIIFAATALPLFLTHARIDPFHFLFAAWALASVACMALVFRW